jgi:hypothetical protein
MVGAGREYCSWWDAKWVETIGETFSTWWLGAVFIRWGCSMGPLSWSLNVTWVGVGLSGLGLLCANLVYLGFCVGEKKMCGEWSVSKVWPSMLTWGCNNGTYVWLAGVLHRRSWSSVVLCEFPSHLLYVQSGGVASASVFMCGSLIVTLFFLICPNLFCSHIWHL